MPCTQQGVRQCNDATRAPACTLLPPLNQWQSAHGSAIVFPSSLAQDIFSLTQRTVKGDEEDVVLQVGAGRGPLEEHGGKGMHVCRLCCGV